MAQTSTHGPSWRTSASRSAGDVAGLRRLLAQVRSEPPIRLTAFRLEVEGGVVVRLVEVRLV